jgi:hypothetical protein
MDDARKRGVLISVGLLAPPATAKTMRSSQGLSMSTDGPFAETKEQLGGYYLLECTNEAEAHYWAARMADTGCATCVEFRPLVEIPARVDEAAQVQAVHA